MDERNKLQEQLCISSLSIQRTTFDNAHHFETKSRKIHNSFGFILHGHVEFSTLTEKIFAGEGDLIYIPQGIKYVSHWDGHPQIQFYSIHFLMPKSAVSLWRSMRLQKINVPAPEKVREIFLEMFALSSGDDADQLKTVSLFYQLAAMALPHMQQNTSSKLPASLQAALTYIEENYTTISSVQQIAAACYISEPRLYHLFKEHMNTTPISYLNHLRIHSAVELLANPDLSIQQIADQLNFHSEYYFRKTFKKITGMLPSQLRKML